MKRFKRLFRRSPRSTTPDNPSIQLAAEGLGEPGAALRPVPGVPHPPLPPGATLSVPAVSGIVQNPSVASVVTPRRATETNVEYTAWTGLKMLMTFLDKSADVFGPLKSAFTGIDMCIEVFEREARGREDYRKLKAELDQLFEDLSWYFRAPTPPAMTAAFTAVAKDIGDELQRITKKHERGGVERYAQAMKDDNEVLECYRRIQGLLTRLMLNTNMNIMKTVDDQAIDNRLNRLPNSPAATYRSSKSENLRRSACTPNTRVDVMSQLHDWVFDGESRRVYWLNGMAGTGKTTIAYTLCSQLERSRRLAASFFCTRQLPACRDVDRIVPSIAYQLSLFSQPFRRALSNVLERDPEACNQSLAGQFEELIATPLREVSDDFPADRVAVIDALDECEDKDGVDRLLDVMLSNTRGLPIKLFVTSRPDAKILDRMQSRQSEGVRTELRLHELERSTVEEDIRTYLTFELRHINLSQAHLNLLVRRSGVLFIYAATVVRYIGSDTLSSSSRLEEILDATAISASTTRELDAVYTTILSAAFQEATIENSDLAKMELLLRMVVGAQEPLSMKVIASLLGLDSEVSVRAALRPFFSVLQISADTGIVTTLHESFPNYIHDRARSERFYCDARQHNARMARLCFEQIEVPNPPFNICGLESSHLFDEDVPDLGERIEHKISGALYYSCRYWGSHLSLAAPAQDLLDRLEQFLSLRLLLWLEILNLKKCMSEGGRALYKAQAWTRRTACSKELQALMWDARHFLTFVSAGLSVRSTPHIYLSGLPFWPKDRPVSKHYSPRFPCLTSVAGTGIDTRKSVGPVKLDAQSEVHSVVYSPDGSHIAAGCADGLIRVWDAHTGQQRANPLEGHTGRVYSIAYSPDSARIVSGSEDESIRIWDAHTGQQIFQPLENHSETVLSVAYSSNGARIVSGSEDRTIRIWDAHTGQQIGQPLKDRDGYVISVVFSPDGSHVLSGSCYLRIWDVHTGQQAGGPRKSSKRPIYSAVYSPDGTHIFATCYKTIRILDAYSGQQPMRELSGHEGDVTSVTCSPDSAYIASGSEDHTIRIWDVHTGQPIGEPIKGHTGPVHSVSYSPDGGYIVSGSADKTICIWDARDVHHDQQPQQPLEGHTGEVYSVDYSPNCAHIVSCSWDGSIRIWDAYTGEQLGQVLEGDISPGAVVYSPDGAHIASCLESGIFIWDAHTLQQLAGSPSQRDISKIAYSLDGARLIYSSDRELYIWDTHTNKHIGQPLEMDYVISSIACSLDGAYIVAGSGRGTIQIWDAHTSQPIGEPLKGHLSWVPSVACSPDSAYIISGSDDRTIRIWDAHSGRQVREPLKGHTDTVRSVAYSPDGARIASGSMDMTIRIWDPHTGQQIRQLPYGHTAAVTSVIYSRDGTCIVSGSWDHTIHVWDVSTCRIGSPAIISVDDKAQPLARSHPRASSRSSLNDIAPQIENSVRRANDLSGSWVVDKDGWVVLEGRKLLIWVPTDIRNKLISPERPVLISPRGSVRLKFSDEILGGRWSQCYQLETST
ncbi:hypothetical protein FRC08_008710 [Ceratobasidium sp. 394]|nr:hypothetical protein FRC08_008710 [Ceratobasidium sp. 394]